MRSNWLLPLLAAIVVLIAVLVSVKTCSVDDSDQPILGAVPLAPAPDADTPADTIKTLTANVSAMTSELRVLRQDNAALKQENRQLLRGQRQIETNVLSRLEKKLAEQSIPSADPQNAALIAALNTRVDALTQSLSAFQTAAPNHGELPVGLGLEGLSPAVDTHESLVWVAPLEKNVSSTESDNALFNRFNRSAQHHLGESTTRINAWLDDSGARLDQAHPVYTIPRNATLIGATAMTALVGRVPVQGQVRDPMPFKVITGKENLAANGLSIPGVEGMIWSGTAIGDWTLSCVLGKLESVTFVFEDGTIQTHANDASQLKGTAQKTDKPLGWISDAQGIPCISGARKTNAPAFLTQRIGVMALEAAGQAAAQAETTTQVSDAGTTSRTVTGDTGHYILGKTLSGGSEEIAKWLHERQAQSFDAVFVPAGIELAIHVDHELPIDFHTQGRKLYHGKLPSTNSAGALLSGLD